MLHHISACGTAARAFFFWAAPGRQGRRPERLDTCFDAVT